MQRILPCIPRSLLHIMVLLLANHFLQAAVFTIPQGGILVQIEGDGLRMSFQDARGRTLMPASGIAGGFLNGSPLSIERQLDRNTFQLVSKKGESAKLHISEANGRTAITVSPGNPPAHDAPHIISLQFGGMPVAYGLGDVGGWNETLNLVNETETTYSLTHDGGRFRWLSSFVIFPQNHIAGVTFDGTATSVTLGKNCYKTSVETSGAATFYFLSGSPETIYANYQSLLREKGFPIIKPKFRLFELGWESWAALGWQTNSRTMLDSIRQFQNMGYPIRWAISGSGFWEEGGTTTSFGKWGKKFPDPMEFKKALHEIDVKWMIGLRTNFVPSGGPYKPVTKDRDQNLVVETFHGNPASEEGIDKNFFLKNADGTLWKKSSPCFPLVPCYLIDGRTPGAAEWFAGLYQQWQVDGIKEDAMLNLGRAPLDIFNHPIARIAEDGGLVMARCGSFTSPGTLQRINDTHVDELTRRIPVNYLQNAASGAPNAYSDTVGFRRMKHYSERVVRHAWLMALTAGMAVGESPAHWTKEQQAIFKMPFDFHYRIAPALFDAAMKSYLTGYPATMTPLGIAFPDDPRASAAPNFQWMIGDSLLCAPVLQNPTSDRLDIYLPKGTWFDFDTGEKFAGPQLLKNCPMPVTRTPCFVGGAGVLVLRSSDKKPPTARVYPTGQHPSTTLIHHPDGHATSRITWSGYGVCTEVTDTTTGKAVPATTDQRTGALTFELLPNHNYNLRYAPPTG